LVNESFPVFHESSQDHHHLKVKADLLWLSLKCILQEEAF